MVIEVGHGEWRISGGRELKARIGVLLVDSEVRKSNVEYKDGGVCGLETLGICPQSQLYDPQVKTH